MTTVYTCAHGVVECSDCRDARKGALVSALRRVLQDLTDEVSAIVAFDADATLQRKITDAKAVLSATASSPIRKLDHE